MFPKMKSSVCALHNEVSPQRVDALNIHRLLCSYLQCLSFAFAVHDEVEILANGYAVYHNLGYHWATSLLAFLTLVMTPFP